MSNLQSPKWQQLYFERLMAIIATVNLCLVLFNLSYIPWRDLYWRKFPQITQIYDPVKGIEAYRETQKYLDTVAALEKNRECQICVHRCRWRRIAIAGESTYT